MEPSKRLAIKTRDVTKRAKRAVTSVFVGMLVTGVHRRKASPGNSLGDKPRRAPDNRVRYLGIAKSIDSSVARNYSQVLYFYYSRCSAFFAGQVWPAPSDHLPPSTGFQDPREPQKLFSF